MYHGEDQESPCGCEGVNVVRLVKPYQQHRKADENRSRYVDPVHYRFVRRRRDVGDKDLTRREHRRRVVRCLLAASRDS